MRLSNKWKTYLLKAPAFLLLTGPSGRASASTAPAASQQQQQQQKRGGGGRLKVVRGGPRPSWLAVPSGHDEVNSWAGGGQLASWLRLLRRRLAVTCRPRNIARLLGAVLVACLLLLLVTKGFGARRRGACRCSKFTYSLCQPNDGRTCGPGVKRAFCQQRRCQPRRKLVRCSVPCDAGAPPAAAAALIESSAAAAAAAAAAIDSSAKHQQPDAGCIYAPRRQSRWTRCSDGISQQQQQQQHRSRLLFLQSGPSGADCPATKTERRPCKSMARQSKGCTYETRGAWSQCNRARNEIVNTRRLVDGTVDNCPAQLVEAMRCLRRDGKPKCLYSKWTRWTRCDGGTRRKTRTLVQGLACDGATTVEQDCVIMYPFVPDDSDPLLV